MRLKNFCASLVPVLAMPVFAFASTVTFSTHTQPCSSCVDNGYYNADLNNDGNEDLVFLPDPYGDFSIEFSNGNGTYSAPVTYTLPTYNNNSDNVAQLVFGDFNHDGSMDILAFSGISGKAYIFDNNGKGVFTRTGSFQAAPAGGAYGSITAAVADYNHDGNLDVAYVHDGLLNVWLGNGANGFTAGLAQQVYGNQLVMGDFDGDGKADLLLYGDPAATNTAYVYYGDGTGHFPQSIALSLPSGYTYFNEGDVNSDGRMDVMAVSPSYSANRVFVFYGDSARKFASRTSIPVSRCLADYPAQVADLDGNGLNDLIVEETACGNPNDTSPHYVSVRTRNPNSSYNAEETIYSSPAVNGVTYPIVQSIVLRANQDTRPDLLVQQCTADRCSAVSQTTMFNTTAGNFHTCDAPSAAEGINICSPATNTADNSPVAFRIGAAGPVMMRDVEVWVDGVKKAEQIDGFSYYTFLDSSVSLSPGPHNVTVYAAGWDQLVLKKSFTVNVK